MFVLGNGDVLEAGSGTWATVIDEFKKQDAYGPAFPFACYRHPEDVQWLGNPKDIDSLFPDGALSIFYGDALQLALRSMSPPMWC
jgi:hypothetical protein